MPERQLPGLGLTSFWDDGQNGWGAANNVNLRTLSCLTQLTVSARVAALPTAPAQGVRVILTATLDIHKVALFENGAWVLFTPAPGWVAFDIGAGVHIKYDGSAWVDLVEAVPVRNTLPYDVRFGFLETPIAGEVLDRIAVPRELTFADGFAGSVGTVATPPTAAFTLGLSVGGAAVGTVTISDTGVFTFSTTASVPLVVAAGSLLVVSAPAVVDDSVAFASVTLMGETP